MKSPQKAIILAAGLGKRMRPLTLDLPKPLMPFMGIPVLEHAIQLLTSWGVNDIAINLHHRAESIAEWVRCNPQPGVRLSLSYEPEILGTGGPLRKLDWFIGDEPFWLFNADVIAALSPNALLQRFEKEDPLAALWMHPSRGPRTVEVEDGAVRNFTSSNPGAAGTCTFTGLHLIHPRILDYLPAEETFFSIITAYQKGMQAGETIASASPRKTFWADLGTPGQYLEAHREALSRDELKLPRRLQHPEGIKCTGFNAISEDAKVEPGAQLHNAVVWPGATVHRGSHLSDIVVGPNTETSGGMHYLAVPAPRVLSPGEASAFRSIGWDPERCTAMLFPPRGSDREYLRIAKRRGSALLVRYGTERKENEHYVVHARFLDACGVRVPAVLADRPRHRFTLFEDFGDADLLSKSQGASKRTLRSLYRKSLDVVLRFHEEASRQVRRKRMPLQPGFGPELYAWEHRYFAAHYLKKIRGLDEKESRSMVRELAVASKALQNEPPTLVHRDLQSTNIMFPKGQPGLIDFQGMRWGAAAYDLASLLGDPYVGLDESLQLQLLEYYNSRAATPIASEIFWLAMVQRIGQALGAYGNLGSQKGTERFLEFIPPGEKMMARALNQLDGFSRLKGFFV